MVLHFTWLPAMTARDLQRTLADMGDDAIAAHSARFFKTGPGEYGEGDVFRGIRVGPLRRVARQCRGLPIDEALTLLASEWHEDRLLALIILVDTFKRGDSATQRVIYNAYLSNTDRVNNWDLVDASAHKIVGPFLHHRSRSRLYVLAGSASLWERRIAIIATLYFIRLGEFVDTLAIAKILVTDPEPLIHKAVGWMLREVGKRDLAAEEGFLMRHYRSMPRTMLRYAIERFPEPRRRAYLKGEV